MPNTPWGTSHPALCATCAAQRADLAAAVRTLGVWLCAGCGTAGPCTQYRTTETEGRDVAA